MGNQTRDLPFATANKISDQFISANRIRDQRANRTRDSLRINS